MASHRLRAQLAPALLALSGIACAVSRDDDRGGGDGIQSDLFASEQTRMETGVSSWQVTRSPDGAVAVLARGAAGELVTEVRGTIGADSVGIVIGASGHRLSVDPSGVVADELGPEELAVLDRFRIDAATALAQGGFRDAEGCNAGALGGGAGGVGGGGDDGAGGPATPPGVDPPTGGAAGGAGGGAPGAVGTCGAYQNDPSDYGLVDCARSVCDAGVECSGVGNPNPGDGDGSEGGSGESGYGESGYGSEGGSGESGYGSESGYGESGYGSESGSGDSGYGESGYGESGYGESGYGESGYGEEGYGEEGYYAPLPEPDDWLSALPIPVTSAALDVHRWDLPGRRMTDTPR